MLISNLYDIYAYNALKWHVMRGGSLTQKLNRLFLYIFRRIQIINDHRIHQRNLC